MKPRPRGQLFGLPFGAPSSGSLQEDPGARRAPGGDISEGTPEEELNPNKCNPPPLHPPLPHRLGSGYSVSLSLSPSSCALRSNGGVVPAPTAHPRGLHAMRVVGTWVTKESINQSEERLWRGSDTSKSQHKSAVLRKEEAPPERGPDTSKRQQKSGVRLGTPEARKGEDTPEGDEREELRNGPPEERLQTESGGETPEWGSGKVGPMTRLHENRREPWASHR